MSGCRLLAAETAAIPINGVPMRLWASRRQALKWLDAYKHK